MGDFHQTVRLPRQVSDVELERLITKIAKSRSEWSHMDYDGDHSAAASWEGGPAWVNRFWLKSCQPGAVLAIEPISGKRFPEEPFDEIVVRQYDRTATGPHCCCHKDQEITPEQAFSWFTGALTAAMEG